MGNDIDEFFGDRVRLEFLAQSPEVQLQDLEHTRMIYEWYHDYVKETRKHHFEVLDNMKDMVNRVQSWIDSQIPKAA